MILDQNLLTSAGLIAAATAVGAFWSQAKGFARYITGFFSLQKELDNALACQVYKLLRCEYRKLPSGISTYTHIRRRLTDSALNSFIPFDMPNTRVSIWFGKRGAFICFNQGQRLLGLRGLFDPQGLVVDALKRHESLRQSDNVSTDNFQTITIMGTAGDPPKYGEHNPSVSVGNTSLKTGDSPDEAAAAADVDTLVDTSFMYHRDQYVFAAKREDPMRGLYYPKPVLDLLEKLKTWYSMREWYEERFIPWRTGALLEGPGGTGKSSLALVIAKTLNLPIYQFYLNTLTDKEFIRSWEGMQIPCVVALEDFDTVFNGREPTTIHKSLSFEAVLNQISGITSLSGVLLIVTTNNLERIDPALGRIDANGRPTRPGRIDHIIHMGMTDEDQRRKIAQDVLKDWPDLLEEMVNSGVDTTAAQFQSMCIQAAVERIHH